jgi:hypothetical protein
MGRREGIQNRLFLNLTPKARVYGSQHRRAILLGGRGSHPEPAGERDNNSACHSLMKPK